MADEQSKLTMADEQSEKKTATITDAEKLLKAQQFKEEGNDCHKKREFRKALGKYHRALMFLKGIGQSKSSGLAHFLPESFMEEKGYSSNLSPELNSQVVKLSTDCYNNLAACLLQQTDPNYEKVIDYCEMVLELDPGNVKACYRKGLSQYHLKRYEKAFDALTQAASTTKGSQDPSIRKYMQLCKVEIIKQEQELKSTYKAMFSSVSSDGDTA